MSEGSESNTIIINTVVQGTGNYIGGYAGQNSGTSSNITIIHSEVIALNINSQYIGGVTGYQHANLQNIVLENVQVHSVGNYVGGVVGIYNGGSVFDASIFNVIVEGNQYVGGLSLIHI